MRTLFILFIWLNTALFSQEMTAKEREFEQLQNEKILLQQAVDSLNGQLNQILARIDQHKARPDADKKRTAEWMAQALSVSKQIERTEKGIKETDQRLSALKQDLSADYARQITALQKQLDRGVSTEQREQIEQELFFLANKRLMVAPLIAALPFDPQRIITIDLQASRDSLDRAILRDYLQNALVSIDSNLQVISRKEKQVEDAKRLEEKARLFADDVAHSRVLGVYEERGSSPTMESDKNLDYSEDLYANRGALANTLNQQNDLLVLVRQLQRMGLSLDDKIDRRTLAAGDTLTIEQYLDLLKKSRQFLTLYRGMLQAKMDAE